MTSTDRAIHQTATDAALIEFRPADVWSLAGFVAIILAGAALVVGLNWGYGLAHTSDPAPSPQRPAVVQPQEDEPGWDCHTMGNRTCGPEVNL